MATQTTESTLTKAPVERMLLEVVRKLHPRRAVQVLDFARWLATQPGPEEVLEAEFTPDQLAAEEAAWEAAYFANQAEFRALAKQALHELDIGETWEMVIEQGKLQAP